MPDPSARCVTRELLDELSPNDPTAKRSRRDLHRVHKAMRSLSILRAALSKLKMPLPPRRILELGAGDGSLLLRFARVHEPNWAGIDLTLLDLHDLISCETREAFNRLDWQVTVACEDAVEWASKPAADRYDLCVTTLFLHHFDDQRLSQLLAGIASRTEVFVALEPERGRLSQYGSRLIGLLGANAVTREDAVKSVAAGFARDELSRLWAGVGGQWQTQEYYAKPFTHCFAAVRASNRVSQGGRHGL